MNPQISGGAFDSFFSWAPWVIGAAIYFAFYVAKRRECAPQPTASSGQTYACAGCGRRGSREQMVPQDHGGAVGWHCPHCASAQVSAT